MQTVATPLRYVRNVIYTLLLCLLAQISLLAQEHRSPFKLTTFESNTEVVRSVPLPNRFTSYQLDIDKFKEVLSNAPKRFETATSTLHIKLPQYDGSIGNFQVWESPVLSEQLGKKYSTFHSYYIQDANNPEMAGRIDIINQGVFIYINNTVIGNTYLEPYNSNKPTQYISYQAKDLGTEEQHADFSCGTERHEHELKEQISRTVTNLNPDCQLRRYRLAVSATGEYTQWYGGQVSDAMGKLMVLVSRTNFVFERAMSITFEVIDNNDALIFTNPETDPFNNEDKFDLMHENHTITNDIIGTENYDLGIVVGIVGGGVANIQSVCVDTNKGQASAGSTWYPEGYPLEATFIHEIGHKFGASHSFNNYCGGSRTSATAYEPGSGSSLMSYAGACAPSITYPRDFYFHPANVEQISDYVLNTISCAELVPVASVPPTPIASLDKALPTNTAFELTGLTNNTSVDPALYLWAQMDKELAIAPPLPTNFQGPSFRVYNPIATSTRSFPKVECILDSESSTDCHWEVVPSVARNMSFYFTAYNMNQGLACPAIDDVNLQFVSTGSSFAVTYPNGGEHFIINTQTQIEWNVAATDLAPINGQNVDIWLSTDGGHNFDILLAENYPNTGQATVNLPAVHSTECRIKIKGNNHYFFDLSDEDFSIGNAPDFTLTSLESSVQSYCGEVPNTFVYEINVNAENGFAQQVSFPAADGSNSVTISPSIVIPPATITVQVAGEWANNNQQFEITGTNGNISRSITLSIENTNGIPAVPQLTYPFENALTTATELNLSWSAIANATHYEVEIAENPNFSNLYYSATTDNVTHFISELPLLSTYYWRVRSVNACGTSAWSALSAFKTKNRVCSTYESVNTPRPIAEDDYADAFARVTVEDNFEISKAKISQLDITHSHIGDLSGYLISAEGTVLNLFYRPGYPTFSTGCMGDGMSISLYDDAPQTNEELRNTCNPVPPTIGIEGAFQAKDSLSTLIGENSQGQWLLNINDLSSQDGGEVTSVILELCRDDIQPVNDLAISSTTLQNQQFETSVINGNVLQLSEAEGSFQIISLPTKGTLLLNGNAVNIGTSFSVNEVNNGNFTYVQNGIQADADGFYIDAKNTTGEWSGIHYFNIEITNAAAIATANITQTINCASGNNGAINIDVIQGYPPYTYSLDGENYQSMNTFTGLGAGDYTIYVKDAANNVVQSNALNLSEPTPITASIVVNEQDIIVEANGGTATYTYSLDGINFQNENVLQTTQDGSYTVIVRDANGCTFETNVTVNNIISNLEITQEINCTDSTNAALAVAIQNGIPPFQYKLNEGAYQESNEFTNLGAGSYTVQILDGTNTTYQTSTVEITNPQPMLVTTEAEGYLITINVENDQAPFQYSVNGNPFTTENSFSTAPLNAYTVIVQNAAGCTQEIDINVDIVPPTIANVSTENLSCYNSADGSIIVEGEFGVAPYTYSLNGNDFQASNEFSISAAGTYTVQVRDAGGFLSDTLSTTITAPAQIQMSALSEDGNIVVFAEDGTGTYTYSMDNENYQESNVFNAIENGIYTLYVRDENGCVKQITYIHTANSLDSAAQTSTVNSCNEDAYLSVDVCITGGIAPYILNETPPADSIEIIENIDCEMHYILHYNHIDTSKIQILTTDYTGAQFTNVVTIHYSETLSIAHSFDEDNLTVFAVTGNAPFEFSIDGENYQEDGYFPDLEEGTYTIWATDANGCSDQIEVILELVDTNDNNEVTLAPLFYSVYPNPANDFIVFNWKEKSNTPTIVSIFNAAGKEVCTLSTTTQEALKIDISSFANGFYGIQVRQGDRFSFEKLVVLK